MFDDNSNDKHVRYFTTNLSIYVTTILNYTKMNNWSKRPNTNIVIKSEFNLEKLIFILKYKLNQWKIIVLFKILKNQMYHNWGKKI